MTQFQFNGSDRAVLEVDNTVNIFNGSLADESLAHFPPLTRTLFTTCFCFTLLFGTIGNLLVVTVVWNDKELSRSSTGVFIANLSIADLLVLVICLPSSIVELQSPPFVWVLPSALCKTVLQYILLLIFNHSKFLSIYLAPRSFDEAKCLFFRQGNSLHGVFGAARLRAHNSRHFHRAPPRHLPAPHCGVFLHSLPSSRGLSSALDCCHHPHQVRLAIIFTR